MTDHTPRPFRATFLRRRILDALIESMADAQATGQLCAVQRHDIILAPPPAIVTRRPSVGVWKGGC